MSNNIMLHAFFFIHPLVLAKDFLDHTSPYKTTNDLWQAIQIFTRLSIRFIELAKDRREDNLCRGMQWAALAYIGVI